MTSVGLFSQILDGSLQNHRTNCNPRMRSTPRVSKINLSVKSVHSPFNFKWDSVMLGTLIFCLSGHRVKTASLLAVLLLSCCSWLRLPGPLSGLTE